MVSCMQTRQAQWWGIDWLGLIRIVHAWWAMPGITDRYQGSSGQERFNSCGAHNKINDITAEIITVPFRTSAFVVSPIMDWITLWPMGKLLFLCLINIYYAFNMSKWSWRCYPQWLNIGSGNGLVLTLMPYNITHQANIGWSYGLLFVSHQAITWNIADILSSKTLNSKFQ